MVLLNYDVIRKICDYIDWKTLVNLRLTCTSFVNIPFSHIHLLELIQNEKINSNQKKKFIEDKCIIWKLVNVNYPIQVYVLRYGSLTTIQKMINLSQISRYRQYIIPMLAQFGRHKIIREVLFTTDLNPTAENCSAMLLSTGSEETSKLLLQDERINPMEIGAELRKFKAETLKLLLMDERVDPSMNNNLLFQESCRFGNLQICKLLLQNENVDPSAHNNWALKVAKKFHRYRIEELLLTDQRVLDRITN